MRRGSRWHPWRAGARRTGRRRTTGPICTVTLDLRGVAWGADPVKAASLLERQPGILDVRVDARRRRAVVHHDANTSLPQLWNWLVAQSAAGDGPSDHTHG